MLDVVILSVDLQKYAKLVPLATFSRMVDEYGSIVRQRESNNVGHVYEFWLCIP